MTVEATPYKEGAITVIAPTGGYSPGEVIQLPDGRAGIVQGLQSILVNEAAALQVSGRAILAKTASVVILRGGRVYWNRSANTATPLQAAAGAHFFVGVAMQDAASADTTVEVDLNVEPTGIIDLFDENGGEWDTVIVLTAGTPALTVGPGYAKLAFSTTAEAQKVDMLSKQSIPVTVPFIADIRCAVYDIGDAAAVDYSIGLANATHATDADSITESLFIHFDGSALDIKAESDDGTTEVAATDTTVDAVDDTYFDITFDCRDLTAIKIYINGVRVLSSTAFKLNAATGPLKGLVHIEKTSDDSPGDLRISRFHVRAMDVAN